MDVYRSGGVTIASAPGAGVADDKAVYTYVPEMIRFYLGEEPILNNVPTWQCSKEDDLKYVLDKLPELVVKEVHGSGGYGMLVGPKSSKEQIEPSAIRSLRTPIIISPSRRLRSRAPQPSWRRGSPPRAMSICGPTALWVTGLSWCPAG